jgi:hypothetical protein
MDGRTCDARWFLPDRDTQWMAVPATQVGFAGPWIRDGWQDLRRTLVFAGPLYAMNRVSTACIGFCRAVNTRWMAVPATHVGFCRAVIRDESRIYGRHWFLQVVTYL